MKIISREIIGSTKVIRFSGEIDSSELKDVARELSDQVNTIILLSDKYSPAIITNQVAGKEGIYLMSSDFGWYSGWVPLEDWVELLDYAEGISEAWKE